MTIARIGIASGIALVLAASVACDSGDKKADDSKKAADKKDDKAADAKKTDGKDAPPDAKADDGGGADAAEPAKPVVMKDLSLSDAGLEAKLQAPEGAKAAEEFGAFTVTSGETFRLEIHTGEADLAARKTEIQGNDVNKLKSFVVESPTELVYETEVMGQSEFHFVANVTVDGAKYHCEDIKGKAYARADVDAMLASCKSLTAE